jgi:hypothetical protein
MGLAWSGDILVSDRRVNAVRECFVKKAKQMTEKQPATRDAALSTNEDCHGLSPGNRTRRPAR